MPGRFPGALAVLLRRGEAVRGQRCLERALPGKLGNQRSRPLASGVSPGISQGLFSLGTWVEGGLDRLPHLCSFKLWEIYGFMIMNPKDSNEVNYENQDVSSTCFSNHPINLLIFSTKVFFMDRSLIRLL